MNASASAKFLALIIPLGLTVGRVCAIPPVRTMTATLGLLVVRRSPSRIFAGNGRVTFVRALVLELTDGTRVEVGGALQVTVGPDGDMDKLRYLSYG